MNGIGGYQQGLMYQDGLYGGLMVAAASGLNVRVAAGLAIVGNSLIEQTSTGASTDILCLAGTTNYVYVNHPDAVDGASAAIATFDVKPEANQSKVNINGSTGTLYGRSIVLAKVVTSANSGTVTIAGTWAAADTATAVINGVTVTVTAADSSVTNIAILLRNAINAHASLLDKVVATSSAGVVTITALTSGTVSAYTLTASEVTVGNGTATASGATLAGAAVTSVDNTERLKLGNIPGAMWTTNLNA